MADFRHNTHITRHVHSTSDVDFGSWESASTAGRSGESGTPRWYTVVAWNNAAARGLLPSCKRAINAPCRVPHNHGDRLAHSTSRRACGVEMDTDDGHGKMAEVDSRLVGPILKLGVLYKLGQFWKRWRPRTFMLTPHTLYYFVKWPNTRSKGKIPLSHVLTVTKETRRGRLWYVAGLALKRATVQV